VDYLHDAHEQSKRISIKCANATMLLMLTTATTACLFTRREHLPLFPA
jgi:hypothetical protein